MAHLSNLLLLTEKIKIDILGVIKSTKIITDLTSEKILNQMNGICKFYSLQRITKCMLTKHKLKLIKKSGFEVSGLSDVDYAKLSKSQKFKFERQAIELLPKKPKSAYYSYYEIEKNRSNITGKELRDMVSKSWRELPYEIRGPMQRDAENKYHKFETDLNNLVVKLLNL